MSPDDNHGNRKSTETCEEKSRVARGIGNKRREGRRGGIFDQSYVTWEVKTVYFINKDACIFHMVEFKKPGYYGL